MEVLQSRNFIETYGLALNVFYYCVSVNKENNLGTLLARWWCHIWVRCIIKIRYHEKT